VDSRVKILKLLDKRNYTLSELSEKLALSKPAIKEHLVILESADLIKKLPSSNKWIYYSLTKSGKKIIQPEGVRVLFMFVFSLFATCVIGFI
jgi:predicted transcriptional regulator